MARPGVDEINSQRAAACAKPQQLLLANLLPDAFVNSNRQSSSAASTRQGSQAAGSSRSGTQLNASAASRWWYRSEQEKDDLAYGGASSGEDTEAWVSPLEESDADDEFFDTATGSLSRKATALDMRQQILTCTKLLKELQGENDMMMEELRQTQEAHEAVVSEANAMRGERERLHMRRRQKHDAMLEAQAEAEKERSRWLQSEVELHKAQVALVSIVEELERRIEGRDKLLTASERRRALLEASLKAQEQCSNGQ